MLRPTALAGRTSPAVSASPTGDAGPAALATRSCPPVAAVVVKATARDDLPGRGRVRLPIRATRFTPATTHPIDGAVRRPGSRRQHAALQVQGHHDFLRFSVNELLTSYGDPRPPDVHREGSSLGLLSLLSNDEGRGAAITALAVTTTVLDGLINYVF